jgi:hypothetical protein
MRRRSIPAYLVAAAAPILLIGTGLLAALQGTFSHPHGVKMVRQDIHNLATNTPVATDSYFPYIRDYPTLITLMFTGITIALAYRNCVLMQKFLPFLKNNGLTFVRPANVPVVAQALVRTNRRFALICRSRAWLLLASSVIATMLMLGSRFGSTFAPLSPHTSGANQMRWSRRADNGWWASVSWSHWFGACVYFMGASFIVYVIVKHNLVGICFVSFFVSTRSAIEYRVDRKNRDGYFGWQIMHDLLGTVFFSLIASIVAFASMFILLPIDSAPWTIPFLVLYFVGVPTYVILPMRLLDRAVEGFREREVRLTVEGFRKTRRATQRTSFEWLRLDALERQEISEIRNLKPRLFRAQTVAVAALLYVFPILTSVTEIFLSYLQVFG